MSLPVFFGHQCHPVMDSLQVGDLGTLCGDEARHAVSVRRLTIGERFDLVDGAGLRLTCRVQSTAKTELVFEVVAQIREENLGPELILVQALAKGGRDEQAVETSVELGVDKVVAWQSERSIVRWVGPKIQRGKAKWENIVRAATKQSRRSLEPEVFGPLTTTEVVGQLRKGDLLLVLHEEAEVALPKVLAGNLKEAERIFVMVGPEGGISAAETAQLNAGGAHLVRLGRTILRSSSAGPAALAVIASRCRWT